MTLHDIIDTITDMDVKIKTLKEKWDNIHLTPERYTNDQIKFLKNEIAETIKKLTWDMEDLVKAT